MPSHLDALQTIPVDLRRLPGDFHSVAKQASFQAQFFRVPERFWSDFGRLWEAKVDAKIDFWKLFCAAFFECVLASIFAQFLEAPNLKNHAPASTGA